MLGDFRALEDYELRKRALPVSQALALVAAHYNRYSTCCLVWVNALNSSQGFFRTSCFDVFIGRLVDSATRPQ